MLTVRFDHGGVHLPELGLWLDARKRQPAGERVFVSHAHSDHIASHREVILTAPTAKFMQLRLKGERHQHILPFGQPAPFSGPEQDYRITLLPAGHILGSAMALVQTPEASLLYTGDFKLHAVLSAEACQPHPADVLVMETTFGRPHYRFPPAASVWSEILGFCRSALADGETPVLLGYSLGKSQQLLRGVAEAGLPVMLHSSAFEIANIYTQFGQQFPPFELFDLDRAPGKVLIFPPRSAQTDVLAQLGRVRTAVCTGWAIVPNCRFRYGTDAAFPLSDHSDFDELLAFVHQVGPKKVFTLHGFAADFAQTLRDQGYDAQALSEPDQLHLHLH